jgi:chemotaxis response regulator CheB
VISVVLSGVGSDCTLGLQAIKSTTVVVPSKAASSVPLAEVCR